MSPGDGGAAELPGIFAPGVVPAAVGVASDAGDIARDGGQGICGHAHLWDAVEQGPGIGVAGVFEYFGYGAGLHKGSGVHHGHPVAEMGNNAQIVGDHDQPHILLGNGFF